MDDELDEEEDGDETEKSCCILSFDNLSHKIDHYNNDIDQQKVILNNDMDMDMDMDIDHSVATTTTTRKSKVLLLLLLSIIVELL